MNVSDPVTVPIDTEGQAAARRTDPRSAAAESPWMGRLRMAGVAAGLILLVLLHVLPPPEPITSIGMGRVGILAFAILWWIFAPVSLAVTTLAALAFGVATGVLTLNEAFAPSTSWLLWFLVGAFGMSTALEVNGFNRRFALWFVTLPWLRGRPYALLFMFLLSAGLMSGVMSNTVVTVVWLSLARTIYSALSVRDGDQFAEMNTLSLAWLANIGGIMTPIGTPGNAVAIGFVAGAAGYTIGFAEWSIIGCFAGAMLIASTFLMIRYVVRPDMSVLASGEADHFLRTEYERLGKAQPAELWSIGLFGAAIVLWFVPDLVRFTFGDAAVPALFSNFGLSVPALLAPVAMCIIPVKQGARRRVLTWDEWSRGVDWGMVLFIAGVLALGTAVGDDKVGVPAFLQRTLEPAVAGLTEYVFVFTLMLAVMVVTNVMSNLATTAIFMPLGLTLSLSLNIGDPLALGVLLGISPSLSYALPSGTTTNAIVAGTGLIRIGLMARFGFVLMCVHAVLLTLFVYPFAKLILP